MKHFVLILLVFIMLGLTACSAANSANDPTANGWTLVWQDEFDSDQINPDYWVYDLGAGIKRGDWGMQPPKDN